MRRWVEVALAACCLSLPWLASASYGLSYLKVAPFALLAALGILTSPLGTRGSRVLRSLLCFAHASLGALYFLALAMGSRGFDAAFYFHFEPAALPVAPPPS